jgi:hypothetical protein
MSSQDFAGEKDFTASSGKVELTSESHDRVHDHTKTSAVFGSADHTTVRAMKSRHLTFIAIGECFPSRHETIQDTTDFQSRFRWNNRVSSKLLSSCLLRLNKPCGGQYWHFLLCWVVCSDGWSWRSFGFVHPRWSVVILSTPASPDADTCPRALGFFVYAVVLTLGEMSSLIPVRTLSSLRGLYSVAY